MKHSTFMKSFELHTCSFHNVRRKDLFRGEEKCSQNVSIENDGDCGIGWISELQNNRRLCISIENCELCFAYSFTLIPIIETFKIMQNIKSLTLWVLCKLTKLQANALADLLEVGLLGLKYIFLNVTMENQDDYEPILKNLSKLSTLTSLHLWNEPFTTDTLKYLADIFNKLQLEECVLEYQEIFFEERIINSINSCLSSKNITFHSKKMKDSNFELFIMRIEKNGRKLRIKRIYDDVNSWLKEKLDNSDSTSLWKSGQSTDITSLLNPYKYVRTLGAGSFGTVYHATFGHESFAVKEISLRSLDTMSREKCIQLFEKERKMLKTLMQNRIHENIVQYKNCHMIEDGLDDVLIVMEYVNGVTLEEIWELPNELHYYFKIKIALGTCRGLTFLQERNIVHKDIKPANVLVTNESYIAKIADFGLSEIKRHMTRKNTLRMGTELYQPPEILLFHRHSSKSDIYSFAATIVTLWWKQQFMPKWYCEDKPINIIDVINKETICADDHCWNIVPEEVKIVLEDALHPYQGKRPKAKNLLSKFEQLFSTIPTLL